MPDSALKSPRCHPTEIALKSFFLGPQSENAQWLLERLNDIMESWFAWRRGSFPQDGSAIGGWDQEQPDFKECQERTCELLRQLCQRFEGELPKFSPRYVGHMFSELSMPALLGHILTLLHNPNIIAKESATVATGIENEAIEALAHMLGLDGAQGHFTSGGTVANFESVVRANARLHLWMAAAAVARQDGQTEFSLASSAHLGWQRFEELRAGRPEEELSPFLPEMVGGWSAAQALSRVFGEEFQPPRLFVPTSAHYSWKKAARVLGVGEACMEKVASDHLGRYRTEDLADRLERCRQQGTPVLAVVSVAGTTETGSIDPVDQIAALIQHWKERHGWHLWHHVDAAYGGFFCSMLRAPQGGAAWSGSGPLREPAWRALQAIASADSVTLDPHKLGYVPYSSGAFLCADARDYTCVQVLAPYLDYDATSSAHHHGSEAPHSFDRGPYTLEGSRSAGGAVATWLTARSIGLDQSGYGLLLARTVRQKQKLESWLAEHLSSARIFPSGDTNLLCFCVADAGDPLSITNARTHRILNRLSEESRYYLTKTSFPVESPLGRHYTAGWSAVLDQPEVVVLRLCLMNPFFDSVELDVDHMRCLVVAICEVSD